MRADRELTPNDLFAPDARAPEVAASVRSLLDELGYAVGEFVVVEETQSMLARELGLLGGLLRVQCRSTGEERLYSTGRGSAWMASVLGDLDDGHFARARRHARARPLRSPDPQAQADFADTTPDVRWPAPDADDAAIPARLGASPFATGRAALHAGFGGR